MRTTLPALLAVICAQAAMAQGQTPRQVDQAVGDLDLLSRSLRHMSPGLRADGEHSSLYQVQPEAGGSPVMLNGQIQQQPAYYRVGPGFAAKVDRLDYVVRRGRKDLAANITPRVDGEFLEIIPANTVFVLDSSQDPRHQQFYTPEDQAASPASVYGATMVQPRRVDNRVDARLDLSVDRRVDNRLQPLPAPVAMRPSIQPDSWNVGRARLRPQNRVVNQPYLTQPAGEQRDNPSR